MKRSGMPRRKTALARVSKKPGYAHTKKALSALARKLVVELRDGNICQRCGSSGHDAMHRNRAGKMEPGPPQIHWAHVRAGRAVSLTWTPWASMALCAGCHFWFDGNGNGKPETQSRRWWAEKFPDRDLLLRQWEQTTKRKKFDAQLARLWLEQEIRRLA